MCLTLFHVPIYCTTVSGLNRTLYCLRFLYECIKNSQEYTKSSLEYWKFPTTCSHVQIDCTSLPTWLGSSPSQPCRISYPSVEISLAIPYLAKYLQRAWITLSSLWNLYIDSQLLYQSHRAR